MAKRCLLLMSWSPAVVSTPLKRSKRRLIFSHCLNTKSFVSYTVFFNFRKKFSMREQKHIISKYSSVFRKKQMSPPPPNPFYGGKLNYNLLSPWYVVHTIKHNELICLSLWYLCKFGRIPYISSCDTCSETKLKRHIHANLLKSANWLMRYFCLKFSSLSAGVTFKIRSRSPKPI